MEEGVWRTIRGRRIYIKKGQDLGEAMQESGKFKDIFGKNIGKEMTKNNKDIFVNDIKQAKEEVDNYINDMFMKGYNINDVYGELHTTEKNSFNENVKSFSSHYGDDINTFVDIYGNKIDYITLSLQRGTNNKSQKVTINLQKQSNSERKQENKTINYVKEAEQGLDYLKQEMGLKYRELSGWADDNFNEGWKQYIITGPNHWLSTFDKVYKKMEQKVGAKNFHLINLGIDGFVLKIKEK